MREVNKNMSQAANFNELSKVSSYVPLTKNQIGFDEIILRAHSTYVKKYKYVHLIS